MNRTARFSDHHLPRIADDTDYTLGSSDTATVLRALQQYAEYLDGMHSRLRHAPEAETVAASVYSEACDTRKIRDIFNSCFEIVAHGVGEG